MSGRNISVAKQTSRFTFRATVQLPSAKVANWVPDAC